MLNHRRPPHPWPLQVVLAILLCTGSASSHASGLVPGTETAGLDDLDPAFRDQIDVVLSDLRDQGLAPRVAATYRDPERQQLIYDVGKLLQLFGSPRMTNARAGQSCHNHRDSAGGAASLAADIVPGPELATAAERAAFFHALGKAAAKRGLGWGGAWPRRNRTWKRYGLGWDPGHVQSARCRW